MNSQSTTIARKRLYQTAPYWLMFAMATMLSTIGFQAEGLAYLPFAALMMGVAIVFGGVRVN